MDHRTQTDHQPLDELRAEVEHVSKTTESILKTVNDLTNSGFSDIVTTQIHSIVSDAVKTAVEQQQRIIQDTIFDAVEVAFTNREIALHAAGADNQGRPATPQELASTLLDSVANGRKSKIIQQTTFDRRNRSRANSELGDDGIIRSPVPDDDTLSELRTPESQSHSSLQNRSRADPVSETPRDLSISGGRQRARPGDLITPPPHPSPVRAVPGRKDSRRPLRPNKPSPKRRLPREDDEVSIASSQVPNEVPSRAPRLPYEGRTAREPSRQSAPVKAGVARPLPRQPQSVDPEPDRKRQRRWETDPRTQDKFEHDVAEEKKHGEIDQANVIADGKRRARAPKKYRE